MPIDQELCQYLSSRYPLNPIWIYPSPKCVVEVAVWCITPSKASCMPQVGVTLIEKCAVNRSWQSRQRLEFLALRLLAGSALQRRCS